MKKRVALTAAGILAIGAGSSHTGAFPSMPPSSLEQDALEAALRSGSQADLELFLERYPSSPSVGKVLGELIGRIEPHWNRSQPMILYAQYGGGSAHESSQMLQNNTPAIQQPPVLKPKKQVAGSFSQPSTVKLVERAAGRLDGDVSRCDTKWDISKFNKCIGDALGRFATDLSSPKIELPPALKPVKTIIARAAREVRAASTAKAARAAVQKVIAEVHKEIKLAEVSGDALADVGARAGNIIAASLQRVDAKLAQVEL